MKMMAGHVVVRQAVYPWCRWDNVWNINRAAYRCPSDLPDEWQDGPEILVSLGIMLLVQEQCAPAQ